MSKQIAATAFEKNNLPHSLKLALCIITGEVESSNCSCVTGKVGYCNHILARMFKLCKFSLFGCKFTEDLCSDSDQQAKLACTPKLQQWYKKGGGANICPEPVMEIVISKTRLDEVRARCGVKCNLYEARMKVTHSKTDEQNLKIELSKIDPNMGFSQMLVDEDEPRPTVQTKFGSCVVGSYLSYQVGFTESNFKVAPYSYNVSFHVLFEGVLFLFVKVVVLKLSHHITMMLNIFNDENFRWFISSPW